MTTFQKVKDFIYKNEIKKIESLFKKESPEFIKNVLNTLEQGLTLLSISLQVSTYNFKLTELFLKYGANPNGITLSGNTDRAPIIEAIYNNKINDRELMLIIESFYMYGFDINYYGNNLMSPLQAVIHRIFEKIKLTNKFDITLLEFFLRKGSNPNIKSALALPYFIESMSLFKEENLHNISKGIDLLLYYGADPYLCDMKGYSLANFIKRSKLKESTQSALLDKIFVNLDDILDECKDKYQIRKLSNAFKIKYDESRLKEICECIKLIKENFKEIDFEEIIELRKDINKFDCVNDSTFLTFTDLNEYNKDDIVELLLDKNKYCFHKNEMIKVIQDKKNPYTNQEIFKDPKEYKEIIKKLDIVPNSDNALEEAIEIFNSKVVIDFSLDDLLDVVTHICKPVNVYYDYRNLKNLNLAMINHLAILLKQNNVAITYNLVSGLTNVPQSYIHLKLYQLLYDTVKFLKKNIQGSLNPEKFSFILGKMLVYLSLINKIVNVFIKYNVDLYNEENLQIIFKTKIENLSNKLLKNFEGYDIPVDVMMLEEILNTILSEEGIEVVDYQGAIQLWNNVLGYFVRIY